ncbi:MAG: hypothetical protein ACRYFX_17235 [Janthinobacterium lividum]
MLRFIVLLALLLGVAPLASHAQLAVAPPVDSATARLALASAARQFPKFTRALQLLQQQDTLLRQVVLVQPARPAGPAAASPTGVVRLDVRYLLQLQPDFDDDRLVVVLYHEIGHLHYYLRVPPGQRTPMASERAAFDYSLLKTRELAVAGDCGPLRKGVYFMRLRSESSDVADPHVRALKQLVQEPAYAEYQRYIATRCGVKP